MNVNSKIITLAAALFSLAIAAGVHVASAQEKSPVTKIAVVDVRFLMQNADAGKNIQAQIEKARVKLQEKATAEEKALDQLSQSIAEERPKLSEDAYHLRMRELRLKVANRDIDIQERQDKLERALVEASNKIAGVIVQIVDEIVKERNFAAVLSPSAVINTNTDITQEVLKRLNQRMPTVTIGFD